MSRLSTDFFLDDDIDVQPVVWSTSTKPRFSYGFLDGLIDILITAIILGSMYIVWDTGWTTLEGRAQNKTNQSVLDDLFAAAPPAGTTPQPKGAKADLSVDLSQLRDGEAFARVLIPRLGDNWQFAVVKGVGNDSLLGGLGHYEQSQLPGEYGNFAIAGHRDGRGAPFFHLDDVTTCDAIVVETATEWLTYRVLPRGEDRPRVDQAVDCMPGDIAATMASEHGEYNTVEGQYITTPSDISVIAPRPGDVYSKAEEQPESLLTITTCNPVYSNVERLIVTAVLTKREGKTEGFVPEALQA